MKASLTKRVFFVTLPLVATLCLAMFASVSNPRIVSAHSTTPQKPQSGCCAVVYTHVATSTNTAADWTALDNKATNNDPNAFVVVTPNRSAGSTVDNHPVGVWYDAMAGKWAVFNEDKAAMPVGAAFNVYALSSYLPNGNQASAILDVASSSNSKGNWTYIDSAVTNGNPNAFINVTSVWNPNGKGGTYDASPLGVWYDATAQKWAIFNEGSMDPIPAGTSFNLLLDTSVINGVFLQSSTSSNTSGNHTDIDNAATNNNPAAIVFATPVYNPNGAVYETHNLGVYYHNGKWAIFNEDNAAMPVGASFDVLESSAVS